MDNLRDAYVSPAAKELLNSLLAGRGNNVFPFTWPATTWTWFLSK